MLLDVFENISVSIYDDETMFKHFNDSADVEVLRSIKQRLVGRAAGFGHSCSLQKLPTDNPRVPDRWFVDRDHVIGQSVCDHKTSAFVLWADRILKHD